MPLMPLMGPEVLWGPAGWRAASLVAYKILGNDAGRGNRRPQIGICTVSQNQTLGAGFWRFLWISYEFPMRSRLSRFVLLYRLASECRSSLLLVWKSDSSSKTGYMDNWTCLESQNVMNSYEKTKGRNCFRFHVFYRGFYTIYKGAFIRLM